MVYRRGGLLEEGDGVGPLLAFGGRGVGVQKGDNEKAARVGVEEGVEVRGDGGGHGAKGKVISAQRNK